MKILFTGGSSFTGMWFARELAKRGHEVTTPFLGSSYTGLRANRVGILSEYCTPIFDCPFGNKKFLQTVKEGKWDLLCHHAADVRDYKSLDFDVTAALENNTCNLKTVLSYLKKSGCHKIVLTGSVFEPGEGEGSDNLRAVSPYGLSKGLTSEYFRYFCDIYQLRLGKFVIPNPFGPYEEPRFTSFLINSWKSNQTPKIATPDYTRDNIHVSLLTKAYCHFAENLTDTPGFEKINPSGYAEKQGAFTLRFAQEMEKRLPIKCPVELQEQKEFPEPKIRINTNPISLDWDETAAWNELAAYYKEIT